MTFIAKPANCHNCAAFKLGRSFVFNEGPRDATLVCVGQGPGEDEAHTGQPFVGRSGRMLDRWLVRAGIPRHKIGCGNVVQCWLPDNRPGTAAEIAHCQHELWGPWLESFTQRRVVVCVGLSAAQTLIDPKLKASAAGEFRLIDGVWYVYLLHPAAVMRGAWQEEPSCVKTLQRAWRLATTVDEPTLPINYSAPPPGSILEPKLADLFAWESFIGPAGITVDLETAGSHIRLVGLCTTDAPHRCLVLPFRRQGGVPYWTNYDEFSAAATWLWRLLADESVPKVFHNGISFDIPVLELNGFSVRGEVFDTMLAQHVALPELPKALEYIAKLYLGVPGWKWLARADTEGEGK